MSTADESPDEEFEKTAANMMVLQHATFALVSYTLIKLGERGLLTPADVKDVIDRATKYASEWNAVGDEEFDGELRAAVVKLFSNILANPAMKD
jgi:hypothetical protein